MPSRHYAQSISPFGLIKEIEGRLSLHLPDKVLKEQVLYESFDQTNARITVIWWLVEEKDYDVPKVIKDATNQVTSDRPDIEVTTTDAKRSFDTGQIMVTLNQSSPKEQQEEKEAKFRKSTGPVKPLVLNFSLEVGGNEYNIASLDSGTTYAVIRNESVVASTLPSVSFAIGKLLKFVLIDLGYVEELSMGDVDEDGLDKDFILSVCEWFANSPVVSKEALKHLSNFVELVTNRKFTPEE